MAIVHPEAIVVSPNGSAKQNPFYHRCLQEETWLTSPTRNPFAFQFCDSTRDLCAI